MVDKNDVARCSTLIRPSLQADGAMCASST